MSIEVIHVRYDEWEQFKEQHKDWMFKAIYEDNSLLPFDKFMGIFLKNRSMTRVEEVANEVRKVMGVPEEYSKIDCFRLGFFEGAKWADATMLDKVCKWLEKNVEYAVMKKNGKHTIELAGVELAEDLQKDMRI